MTSIDLNSAPLVLLDDCRPYHRAGSSILFHSPSHIIEADDFDQLENAFREIDAAIEKGLHVAGWVSYECGRYFEPKLNAHIIRKANEPLVWMMVTEHRETLSPKDVDILLHNTARGNSKQAKLIKEDPSPSETEYLGTLKQVQDYILAGDVYQINYTLPLPVKLEGSAPALYQSLRTKQPVAYGAYIDTGRNKILSLSPELFLKKEGSTLTAKPMKGTIARGLSLCEDSAQQEELRLDEKSQAENLMIVDLIRNDLSRIAKTGSVKVPSLFDIEQYPTLHQMTSTVQAEARDSLKPSELLAAMFPCGSVTGAPKVRAMEIIQSLEKQPRGVYCGTIGYFSPRQATQKDSWCLNVPIRTFVLDEAGSGRIHVGSGVVADSDPHKEYNECLLKAAFTDSAAVDFALIETMRLENGTIAHHDKHLARLCASAQYFDFPYDKEQIDTALTEHISLISKTAHRLRLLLDKYGAVSVTSAPLEHAPDEAATVCLSEETTYSADPFLQHKTTNRCLYNEAFRAARENGHADILFFNEKGELTEGAISNIFLKFGGPLYTPPRSAGLLPGILREELITSGQAVEKTLYREDLYKADEIYIGNALRGLRAIKIAT